MLFGSIENLRQNEHASSDFLFTLNEGLSIKMSVQLQTLDF